MRTVLGTTAGSLLFALGCSNGSMEDVEQRKQMVWWGQDDTVANQVARGYSNTVQPILDRTVSVQISTSADGTNRHGGGSCTGTLITPQVVLTAAHCVNESNAPGTGNCVWPVPAGGTYSGCPALWPNDTTVNFPLSIRVGLSENPASTDQRNLAVPANINTTVPSPWAAGNFTPPFLARYTGLLDADFNRQHDYALLYLEAPETSAARQGVTLQTVLEAAFPDLRIPYAPIAFPAIGEPGLELIWSGYGGTETTATSNSATKPNRQVGSAFLNGAVWRGDNRLLLHQNSNGDAFPDQAILITNFPDGTGVDATGANNGQIEAGYFIGGSGDSGGPVYVDNGNGERNLVALHVASRNPRKSINRPRNLGIQPWTFPAACWGADGQPFTGDDQIWNGTYTNGAPNCVGGTWTTAPDANQNGLLDTNGDGLADWAQQVPNSANLVDLTQPTIYGGPCWLGCDASLGYQCNTDFNICEVKGPIEWILDNAADPARPGRLFGERDYHSYCSADDQLNDGFVDPSGNPNGRQACDWYLDPVSDPTVDTVNQCPAIFNDWWDSVPEMRANLDTPIYGSVGVDLHDRVVVRRHEGNGYVLGDVAARVGEIQVRNDVRLGFGWGGDWLEVGHRAVFSDFTTNEGSRYYYHGNYSAVQQPQTGANVPWLRMSARFPMDGNGNRTYSSATSSGTWDNPGGTTHVNNCRNLVLEPGDSYNEVRVNGCSTLTLSGAGEYYIDTLVTEAGSTVAIDHTGGAVELYIRNSYTPRGDIVNAGGRAYAHVIGYFGEAPLHVEPRNGFRGTLVAPRARMILNSQPHRGAFYGMYVEVHQGSWITHEPCQGI